MDNALDQIADKCSKYLQVYQNCVSKNRQDYGRKCQNERAALTDCAEDRVPVLRNVKKACQGPIQKYDECLSKNNLNPVSCIDFLRNLTECVDVAAKKEGVTIPPPQGI